MSELEQKLVQAIEDLLAEYWTGRKADVRKQFHAMVAENEARKLLDRIREGKE